MGDPLFSELLVCGLIKVRCAFKTFYFQATEEGNVDLEVAREAAEIIKCIVLRCSGSKIVLAHVVPCKGLDEDEFVRNIVANDLA